MNPKIIAFYLPQYHPIRENDEWYGKGFTEWTNVAKAKPLFPGHIQPRIPTDLGFYDLRVDDVIREQVTLAKEAGITAFCYYHYWFGNGKLLLEKPLERLLSLKDIEFPFCMCWANHSWFKKNWNADTGLLNNDLLQKQLYPGDEDIEKHFNYVLPFFNDNRYLRIDGKPVFVLYSIKSIPQPLSFINKWNQLAKENGLPGLYFVSYTEKKGELFTEPYTFTDGTVLSLLKSITKSDSTKKWDKFLFKFRRIVSYIIKRPLLLYEYKDVMKKLLDPIEGTDRIIPEIVPNWDYTPRQGAGNLILKNSTPDLFAKHVSHALELVKNKPENKQVIFLKSWNEWGEGNYMEPDLTWGKGYIQALRRTIEGLEH